MLARVAVPALLCVGTVNKWRRALEAAGVMFIDPDDQDGPGVRLRGAKGKR